MSALDKLIKRCYDMDITEQLNIFDDAFLPSNAQTELEALRAGSIEEIGKLLEGDELYGENGVIVITEEYYTKLRAEIGDLKHQLAHWEVGADERDAEIEAMRISVIKAQKALRSTHANWYEQCLFDCDAFLTEALTSTEHLL